MLEPGVSETVPPDMDTQALMALGKMPSTAQPEDHES
jgi:hypothetical protein